MMSFKYEMPDFEQYMFYVAKTHELRARFCHQIFAGIWNAPAAIVEHFFAIMKSITDDKKVAP